MSSHKLPKWFLDAPFLVSDPGTAGTVNLDNKGYAVVKLISTTSETRTIPAPEKPGQRVLVYLDTDGGNVTITITGGQGITSVVLDDAGDAFELEAITVAGTAKWSPAWSNGPLSGFPQILGGNVTVEGTFESVGNATMDGTLTSTGALTPTGGVAAAGGFTAYPRLVHTGGVPAIATTSGTNSATNTGGTVYFAECFVPCNISVTGIAIFNGTAVAGNGKVILYNSAGVKIAQSVSTLMSGTTAYQLIPLTGGPIAVKGPATYFIGATYDTTTHDLRGHAVGTFVTGTLASTTYATDSTLTPIVPGSTFAAADVGPIASLY